jgi:hypothetical protein
MDPTQLLREQLCSLQKSGFIKKYASKHTL